MSTREWPVYHPLAFIIDSKVAPFLNLFLDKRLNPEKFLTEVIPALGRAGLSCEGNVVPLDDFAKLVEAEDGILAELDYVSFGFDGMDDLACEELCDDAHIQYIGDFLGAVQYLDKEGNRTGHSEDYNEDDLVIIPCEKSVNMLRAPYSSMDEFLDEVKVTLNPLIDQGAFPEDFDWAAHVVSVGGTSWG